MAMESKQCSIKDMKNVHSSMTSDRPSQPSVTFLKAPISPQKKATSPVKKPIKDKPNSPKKEKRTKIYSPIRKSSIERSCRSSTVKISKRERAMSLSPAKKPKSEKIIRSLSNKKIPNESAQLISFIKKLNKETEQLNKERKQNLLPIKLEYDKEMQSCLTSKKINQKGREKIEQISNIKKNKKQYESFDNSLLTYSVTNPMDPFAVVENKRSVKIKQADSPPPTLSFFLPEYSPTNVSTQNNQKIQPKKMTPSISGQGKTKRSQTKANSLDTEHKLPAVRLNVKTQNKTGGHKITTIKTPKKEKYRNSSPVKKVSNVVRSWKISHSPTINDGLRKGSLLDDPDTNPMIPLHVEPQTAKDFNIVRKPSEELCLELVNIDKPIKNKRQTSSPKKNTTQERWRSTTPVHRPVNEFYPPVRTHSWSEIKEVRRRYSPVKKPSRCKSCPGHARRRMSGPPILNIRIIEKEMQSLTAKTSRNGRRQSLLDDPETNPMSSLDISPGIEFAAENTVQNIFEQVGL